MLAQIVGVLLLAEACGRIALAIRVILRRFGTGQTMSWLLVLTFLPVVSTLAYLLVGESRLGARRARRYVEVAERVEGKILALVRERDEHWIAEAPGFETLARMITASSKIPPLRGNRLRLIERTEEFFESLVRDIDGASSHVHMVYFIWTTRGQARAVAEAVIRAARRGVECRVLVDHVGSQEFAGSGLEGEMRRAGVRVSLALPVNPARVLLARIDIRNHRKIAVIDGRVAYTGSHNIADPDFKFKQKPRVGHWVDATVRVEGPVVHVLQGVFLCDWAADSPERVPDFRPYLPVVDAPVEGSAVHVVPSGPGGQPGAIHHAILAMIHDAREELVITTPYFVPDEATRVALQIAARCGVAVTLILPERNDQRLVQAAGRSYYHELMAAGVRIVHYGKGLLHSKTITVDGRMSVITSVNMDMRSFFVNFEVSLMVYDHEFTRQVRAMQEHYLHDARTVDPEAWKRRGLHRVFIENVCQVLGPLL